MLKGAQKLWGQPPWQTDFRVESRTPPPQVDVAIVGGGFTGLAAAAWLKRLSPGKSVVVLEANCLGSGSSARTGGVVMGESAVGNLPGLDDVLKGFVRILGELEIDCGAEMRGVWELVHGAGRRRSPIAWQDSGVLRIADEVPGGSIEPARLLEGLARAARQAGVLLCEQAPVQSVRFEKPLRLQLPHGEIQANQILFSTNAQSLALNGLAGLAQPFYTTALATAPVADETLRQIGLAEKRPFYTVDLPFLWGRVLANNQIVFGSGLVDLDAFKGFESDEASRQFNTLESRVRALHPALRSVEFTHRWGGPILVPKSGRPFFDRHPEAAEALVLGGYAGHGVALSVYLGKWAAQALRGRKKLPKWGSLESRKGLPNFIP